MQDYNNIDQHLHLLCQLPARAAASLIPETDDYSHTNLLYDDVGNRILSRPIPLGSSSATLALDVKKMTFEWLTPSFKQLALHEIPGKTMMQLQKEITNDLTTLNFDHQKLDIPLKYEISNYPFSGERFATFPAQAMEKWAFYRSLANTVGSAFYHHLGLCGEVRIWPHHFDTGVYHEIAGKIGLGFGLAMYDDMVKAPYFYISGYALQGDISMIDLPVLQHGKWLTDSWKGAVLPLPELEKEDENRRMDIIFNFLSQTIRWYRHFYL